MMDGSQLSMCLGLAGDAQPPQQLPAIHEALLTRQWPLHGESFDRCLLGFFQSPDRVVCGGHSLQALATIGHSSSQTKFGEN